MRTLAIDLGTRRVGLAMSDQGGRYATPLDVLEITAPEQALEAVVQLVKREAISRVVIGLPLNMEDGTLGSAAKGVMQWGGRLAMKIMVPILYVDERLSSFGAEQEMINEKRAGQRMTRDMKKQRLDARAAALFLQEFLDGKLLPIELE